MSRLHSREAFDMVRALAAKETQLGLAARLKISPQYLCDVLQGRRGMKGILRRLGYQQVILYERRKPSESQHTGD